MAEISKRKTFPITIQAYTDKRIQIYLYSNCIEEMMENGDKIPPTLIKKLFSFFKSSMDKIADRNEFEKYLSEKIIERFLKIKEYNFHVNNFIESDELPKKSF